MISWRCFFSLHKGALLKFVELASLTHAIGLIHLELVVYIQGIRISRLLSLLSSHKAKFVCVCHFLQKTNIYPNSIMKHKCRTNLGVTFTLGLLKEVILHQWVSKYNSLFHINSLHFITLIWYQFSFTTRNAHLVILK